MPEGAARPPRKAKAARESIRCPTCGSHRLVPELAYISGAQYLCKDCGFRGALVVSGMREEEGAARKVMVVPVRMGRDWEVLVLRRPPAKGSVWAPVTGNVDEGETFEHAAARELQEETGLGGEGALHRAEFVNRFSKEKGGTARAFEERVFAAVIPQGRPVRLSEEHVEAKWVSPAEAVELVAFEGCKKGVKSALEAVEARLR
jgi:8-oxo-dGTP pyrophosphatase MutT (NUDIX family)